MTGKLLEEVKNLHAMGYSQVKIAEILKCSKNTVIRRMKEANLKGKSKGTRDYEINSDVFDVIDNQYKAYWLGFLLADGSIVKQNGKHIKANRYRSLKLSIQARDIIHLEKFAKFINFKGNISSDNRHNSPRKTILFNDVKLTKTLIDKGWLNYKRGISFEIIDIVPDELFYHFIRGYYDGDGCISSQKRKSRRKRRWYANIVCKYHDALKHMNNRLLNINKELVRSIKDRNTVYCLIWPNRANLTNFGSFIYQDNDIKLERKHIRWLEFLHTRPFRWANIHDFSFYSKEITEDIKNDFRDNIIYEGWKNLRYCTEILENDYNSCKKIKLSTYLKDNCIKTHLAPGNKIISHYQSLIFHVSLNNATPLCNISSQPKTVSRAVNNFFKKGALSPSRLLRELRHAGLCRASLLSVPVIIASLTHFKLSGKWFDPCAGWGNRLIAANVLNNQYEATDPGISYKGLVNIKEFIKSDAILHNKKWQDVKWPDKCDFIYTSPPFHNKEDYLDNVDYGPFDKWYGLFLKPLVLKCLSVTDSVVFHVDTAMKNALGDDFKNEFIKIVNSNKPKAPDEWIIKLIGEK